MTPRKQRVASHRPGLANRNHGGGGVLRLRGISVATRPFRSLSGLERNRDFSTGTGCNVLIYFDGASKAKVINHFFSNLNFGGYFFLNKPDAW